MRVRRFLIALLCATALFAALSGFGESRCPRDIEPVAYQSLGLSQIGVQVMINDRGPFEFLLDTGAQITVIDSALVSELGLRRQGTIGIVSVVKYAQADLVSVDSLTVGRYGVTNLQAAVQNLDQIRSVNPTIRGILGDDFLAHFDLLIDNAHKSLCWDETRQMQLAILGERVSVVHHEEPGKDSPYVPPILVSVHLPGDGPQDTVLRIDSGSSAPILFSSRGEILPWLQKLHASRGSVSGAGNGLMLAAMPLQSVRIADHLEWHIRFLIPIGNGTPFARALEDGLLPTALFKEILISFRDGFVVFDPRDACPHPEPN